MPPPKRGGFSFRPAPIRPLPVFRDQASRLERPGSHDPRPGPVARRPRRRALHAKQHAEPRQTFRVVRPGAWAAARDQKDDGRAHPRKGLPDEGHGGCPPVQASPGRGSGEAMKRKLRKLTARGTEDPGISGRTGNPPTRVASERRCEPACPGARKPKNAKPCRNGPIPASGIFSRKNLRTGVASRGESRYIPTHTRRRCPGPPGRRADEASLDIA
jgi:hypothetical protein